MEVEDIFSNLEFEDEEQAVAIVRGLVWKVGRRIGRVPTGGARIPVRARDFENMGLIACRSTVGCIVLFAACVDEGIFGRRGIGENEWTVRPWLPVNWVGTVLKQPSCDSFCSGVLRTVCEGELGSRDVSVEPAATSRTKCQASDGRTPQNR